MSGSRGHRGSLVPNSILQKPSPIPPESMQEKGSTASLVHYADEKAKAPSEKDKDKDKDKSKSKGTGSHLLNVSGPGGGWAEAGTWGCLRD